MCFRWSSRWSRCLCRGGWSSPISEGGFLSRKGLRPPGPRWLPPLRPGGMWPGPGTWGPTCRPPSGRGPVSRIFTRMSADTHPVCSLSLESPSLSACLPSAPGQSGLCAGWRAATPAGVAVPHRGTIGGRWRGGGLMRSGAEGCRLGVPPDWQVWGHCPLFLEAVSGGFTPASQTPRRPSPLRLDLQLPVGGRWPGPSQHPFW